MMTIMDAIQARHSVRGYQAMDIPVDALSRLRAEVEACNREGCLHIQLITKEPKAFSSFMAHYGKFSGVQNYIALIGKKSDDLEMKLGYHGERLAILAQRLGLNTCWAAMTFSKGATRKSCTLSRGERLVAVLAFGYGVNQGTPHKSKPMDALCSVTAEMPEWFRRGMESALLAPTAMNQQKFKISFDGRAVCAQSLGGFYTKVDLGIVKYHFEAGAGQDNFIWQS